MWLGVLNATAYAVAMAYVESAIVVYLRRLYYPKGFDFPLVIIDVPTLLIEVGRETATIVMASHLLRVDIWIQGTIRLCVYRLKYRCICLPQRPPPRGIAAPRRGCTIKCVTGYLQYRQ